MGKQMVLMVCQCHKQSGLSETQFIKSYYMSKIADSGVSWYLQIHCTKKCLIFLGQQNSERKRNLFWSRMKMYN